MQGTHAALRQPSERDRARRARQAAQRRSRCCCAGAHAGGPPALRSTPEQPGPPCCCCCCPAGRSACFIGKPTCGGSGYAVPLLHPPIQHLHQAHHAPVCVCEVGWGGGGVGWGGGGWHLEVRNGGAPARAQRPGCASVLAASDRREQRASAHPGRRTAGRGRRHAGAGACPARACLPNEGPRSCGPTGPSTSQGLPVLIVVGIKEQHTEVAPGGAAGRGYPIHHRWQHAGQAQPCAWQGRQAAVEGRTPGAKEQPRPRKRLSPGPRPQRPQRMHCIDAACTASPCGDPNHSHGTPATLPHACP